MVSSAIHTPRTILSRKARKNDQDNDFFVTCYMNLECILSYYSRGGVQFVTRAPCKEISYHSALIITKKDQISATLLHNKVPAVWAPSCDKYAQTFRVRTYIRLRHLGRKRTIEEISFLTLQWTRYTTTSICCSPLLYAYNKPGFSRCCVKKFISLLF